MGLHGFVLVGKGWKLKKVLFSFFHLTFDFLIGKGWHRLAYVHMLAWGLVLIGMGIILTNIKVVTVNLVCFVFLENFP